MYRDPSEFRERFKAYKDGKSVREIYGLPGYEPGKLPVEEMMPYILAVENPTKQGLVNGVWRPPTDSTKWDVHAIGGGLDIREQHNPIVYNYLKTNGRLGSPFLTAKEEEILREKVFKKTMLPALQNVYNKYGDKISSKGYARLAGMKWQGHPFLMAISPDSVTGKAFIKAIESGDKDLDSVFDAYYKYPANAKRYAARILADTNYWKNHNTVTTKPVPQEPIIARLDATRVAAIPTVQQLAIDYSDRRNAVAAEAERAMWAHNVMEDMKGAYQVPIWESPSLPALTPVEYDVTPLKTYAGGKVAEEDEPVIRQGTKGSRLDRFSRMMDPDEDDGTVTRVIKKVGKGVADLVDDAKTISGLRTAERFATHTLSSGDYVDAAFLTVGNAMISKMLKASPKLYMKNFIQSFTDMDARALGKYFFLEHPELMTQPQEAWYGELAKKSDAYFRLAIDHRVKMFDREGRPLSPESIAALISPDIKIAPIKGSRYGGIYSAPDNTMLVNSDLVKDPRTAAKVYNHERAHAMQTAFENEVGLPYPIRYGTEMEALFPFTAEQKAKRPGVHIGKEIDASLHEVKSLRSYDTNQLGRALDVDFENMSDEEFKQYANNGYFKDIMQNILNGLQAQKKFISKLKNGKLPGYYEGELPMGEQRLLTDEEVKLAAQNASHEQGMSGEDPLMSMLVGMKAVRLVGDLLAERRLKLKAEMYKRWREANELTRDASRAWKMLDADRMARNWGYSDNQLGFFYDIFLDPIANMYTKIQKHPILGPLIPFSDGKLPGYNNGKIRIKPANRGKFNATKKRTGKTTEELTHSKNPLTRKRAIFAQNARKWNHK